MSRLMKIPRNPAYALYRYLSSPYVSLINFTFVLLDSSSCGDEFQEYYLELIAHPQFHTVLGYSKYDPFCLF
jgi:hypothetical protein